jgi:hypothetical protein
VVTKFNLRKRIEERRVLLCFGFLVKVSYRGIFCLLVNFHLAVNKVFEIAVIFIILMC